jgi:hypothetical protein
MDAWKKIALLSFFAAVILPGCTFKKPVNPCPDPLGLGIAYPNASWTVLIDRVNASQTESRTFKVYYSCGNYMIQEKTLPGEPIKALIIRDGKVYMPNFQTKTVFTASALNGGAEPYIKSIFINMGTAKKKMGPLYLGRADEYRCEVQEFQMLRSTNSIYLSTALKEFYDIRTGFIVRMDTFSPASEITMGTKKIILGPVHETYRAAEFSNKPVPNTTFELPPDFREIDIQKAYDDKMKSSGKKIIDRTKGLKSFRIK